MTACWLACKLEEEPRHPRHLIAVFHRLQRRRLKEAPKVLDYYSRVRSSQTGTLDGNLLLFEQSSRPIWLHAVRALVCGVGVHIQQIV